MSQDNFSGGFILGAIVGGVVGGVLGVALVSPKSRQQKPDEMKVARPQRRPLRVSTEQPVTEQSMEFARQGLEAQIAQLNDAIDDVRRQLGSVNGKADVGSESS